jgi:2-keto-4-pentenoate hydratase/2-oxohepta-3-ene-1,7-dioic acid hydratase in catechol pathway
MKIICIGRNYKAHAEELGNSVPDSPMVFMKPPTALLVNNKPFYHPEFSKEIHYELEVVLKICKNGRHVQPEFARSYYKEIALGIDFTARDLQQQCKAKGHPWEIAKGFDHSAVMSPFYPLTKEPNNIQFHLTKNGEVVQRGNTRDLIFNFEELIVYVSQFFKLQVGDYIFTGTPAGVGPISIGDKLEGYLEDEKLLECIIK